MDESRGIADRAPGDAFGARLRRARALAGLTQDELAARAGRSAKAIGALERGERRHPYPSTIRALAGALGLTDAERAALAGEAPSLCEPAPGVGPPRSRLPAALSPLIGREGEVEAVAALLREPNVRLVTLTGPGGVGKTRLALRVAADLAGAFADGAAFVSLAPVRDPALAASTVAAALGVVEDGGRASAERLARALGDRHLLLVLDNYEHLLAAAPLATDLLGRCPRLAVLATSRVVLRVDGEHVYPVPPLAVPDPEQLPVVEDLAGIAAVQLFVERARGADPAFALTDANAGAVAAICHRLDGLPLAIELATARSAVFAPDAMLPLLARRLPLLTGGRRDAPERHRTMRDAIAWSHDLLTTEEQALFRRLAVFDGGVTLDAANAVARETSGRGDDAVAGIAALAGASLVRQEPGSPGGPRFAMLETVREYGLERLAEAGEEQRARDVHAAYYLAWDERLDPNGTGPGERVEDRLWRIDAEHPNLRAALVHLAETGNASGVLRLAGALAVFWRHRGYLDEGRRWLEWALAHTPESPSVARARWPG